MILAYLLVSALASATLWWCADWRDRENIRADVREIKNPVFRVLGAALVITIFLVTWPYIALRHFLVGRW